MSDDDSKLASLLLFAILFWPALAFSDASSDVVAAEEASQRGDNAVAIRLFTAALTQGLSSRDTAGAYDGRGRAYQSEGMFFRAIRDYTRALSLHPDLSDVLFRRGVAYYLTHRWNRAIADYTAALRLEPGRRDVRTNLAYAYLGKGDTARAIAGFSEVLRADPQDASALEGRGDAYFIVDRFDDAIDDFAAVLGINPGDVHDGLWLYLARIRAGKEGSDALRSWALTLTDHSWPYEVVQFYADSISRSDLAVASDAPAQAGGPALRKCSLNAYVGAHEAFLGNGVVARPLLQTALRVCDRNFVEYWLASVELRGLTGGGRSAHR